MRRQQSRQEDVFLEGKMRKCRNKSTLETLLVFLPRFCWVISRRLVCGGQFFPDKQRRTEPLPLPRFWSQNWRIKRGRRGQEERRPPAALLAAQFSFLRSRDCSFIPSPKADRGSRKEGPDKRGKEKKAAEEKRDIDATKGATDRE